MRASLKKLVHEEIRLQFRQRAKCSDCRTKCGTCGGKGTWKCDECDGKGNGKGQKPPPPSLGNVVLSVACKGFDEEDGRLGRVKLVSQRAGSFATALGHAFQVGTQVIDHGLHGLGVGDKVSRAGIELGVQNGHGGILCNHMQAPA